MDNCCCENVGQINCASVINKCGSSPTVVEMSGNILVNNMSGENFVHLKFTFHDQYHNIMEDASLKDKN